MPDTPRHWRTFRDIIVHPVQELMGPTGPVFRGGPDWPHFYAQRWPRHCWGPIAWPVDRRPRPADRSVDPADVGIWCGPVATHFGHTVADFSMRIAASSRAEPRLPLVFSVWGEPPDFFWQIVDHLRLDRSRIRLVDTPTRFARLSVLPQAERPLGGAPSRSHLALMDALTAPPSAPERDLACVFVSRSALLHGRFAGEAYLDRMMSAAGVTVFHPETTDLQTQFRLYRRARRLIFSEGSALHALQLLGHIDADIVVLQRRRGRHIAGASLRPRARSLRYLHTAKGLVYGLRPNGKPQTARAITVLDQECLLTGLAALGIDLAGNWDAKIFAEHRDADIAGWMSHRLATATHSGERATIEARLRALSLRL